MTIVADIRTQIVAVINTVPDVGVVHARERNAANMAKLKELYWYAPLAQLRGWFVRRRATSETGRIQVRSVEAIRWQIVGLMAFNDAAESELQMDALIEALRDAFADNDDLNGTVDQCSVPAPGGGSGESNLQLEDFGPVMFADVLCHGVKLGLNTYRYLTRNP